MIVRDRPTLLKLFFIMKGSILPRIAPKVLLVIGLTVAVLIADLNGIGILHIDLQPLGIFGIALSLFLGFRNNAAYDRWWEARRLWGQLIADCRSFGRETLIFLGRSPDRRILLRLCVVFMHLHRGTLRRVDVRPDLHLWTEEADANTFHATRNPACAPLTRIADHLHDLHARGVLSDMGLRVLSERLANLSQAQAGCERIAGTPLPFVYQLLIYRTILLYCLFVPFGLIDSAGWLAPAFAGVIAYVFFGLAAVMDELEHPFLNSLNGIPLDAMCRTVEISIAEALDEPAPEKLVPVAHVLT